MQIVTTNSNPETIEANAVVVGVYKNGEMTEAAKQLDGATGNSISRLVEIGDINGKANEITKILAPANVATDRIIVAGLGDREQLSRRTAFEAAATAAKSLADRDHGTDASIAMFLDDDWTTELQESAIVGACVGCVGQDLYQKNKSIFPLPKTVWPESWNKEAIKSGQILGDAINLAKRLVNEPPSAIYPESLAAAAAKAAGDAGFEIETWDEERLDEEQCHALLAVGRGSAKESRLCIMRHKGGAKGDPTLALVGKGVTFDSGGLSIKPSAGMLTMKCDMAGSAAVIGAMYAIAKLKLPVNVIGVIGAVENMVGSDSYRLGDVLTSRNGTTIEVHNTDAEGRLVLADALCVAVDEGADRIVDLATLTGSCVVALGENIVGVMSNNDEWCQAVMKAADTAGEAVWQLPMSREFGEQIKSKVADIKNVGAGRWGGAMTAAKLLERFVDERPWVHLDIAGPSFLDKPQSWHDAGGTGVMVRSLVELCRQS